ncbi:hypothetical protein JQC72_00975 [Polycladomyces sp. WAk]|uniref:Uncharacterized protein n=1 Tax=Polycladomyces zharkentensis TaxID=2807616 RepID=A0ABS2WEX5_9BACL|nr:hypothetical protein [Polycladomyces sp. WAk]MBN2908096.1 hypothetical protein [Polycladomyces sp. WAk]
MLLNRLQREGITSLAIVGLAKNVGKTTVLNALIAESRSCGVPVGLLSIGVDGEERDAWSGRPKPPIRVPGGTWVATAGACLDLRGGDWEVIASTPIHSLLGDIYLARSTRSTHVKLAGIPSAEEVRTILRRFQHHGVPLTLVDGAYDRKASASPLLTQGAVLVVGASMGRTLQDVVKKAEETVRIFTLPVAENGLERNAVETALRERFLVGVSGGELRSLPVSSLLVDRRVWQAHLTREEWTALALPGALTDRLLWQMMETGRPFTLLLSDPTRCFATLPTVRRWYRMGGEIRYLHAVRLAAVAVNPVSPEGFSFDPVEMKQRVQEVVRGIPVMDVVRDAISTEA